VTLFDLEPLTIGQVQECVLSRVPSVTALEQSFPAAALSRIGEHES